VIQDMGCGMKDKQGTNIGPASNTQPKPGLTRIVLLGLALAALLVLLALWVLTTKPDAGAKRVFVYDMEALRKIDPALIQFQEERRIESGFTHVARLALNAGGSVLVAGDNAVRTFGPDGQPAGEIKLAGPACAVAVGADGKVYAGLRDHVEVYDGQGALAAKWESLGPGARITALAVAAEDAYIADFGPRVVWRCELSGKVRNKLGARDNARNVPGLIAPSPHLDLACGPDGWVYVCNPGRFRIEAYTPAGDLEQQWGKPGMGIEGFCGCCNPIAFALCPRPKGGFVTSEKGVARVKVLDGDGNLESVVAGPGSFGEDAFGAGVAVDQQGRVYVLDTGTRAVRVFSKRGVQTGTPERSPQRHRDTEK